MNDQPQTLEPEPDPVPATGPEPTTDDEQLVLQLFGWRPHFIALFMIATASFGFSLAAFAMALLVLIRTAK
jgi:hypothetical protein